MMIYIEIDQLTIGNSHSYYVRHKKNSCLIFIKHALTTILFLETQQSCGKS